MLTLRKQISQKKAAEEFGLSLSHTKLREEETFIASSISAGIR